MLPALEILQDNVDALISVDTMFSDIAGKALKLGVDVINDVSGFTAENKARGAEGFPLNGPHAEEVGCGGR